MQAYTTAPTTGQWVCQTLGLNVQSLTVQPDYSNILLFQFIWNEPSDSPPHIINEQELAQLYAEFADEDRALANGGMIDYARLLDSEDGAA